MRGSESFERKASLFGGGYGWCAEELPMQFAGRQQMRIDAKAAFPTTTLERDFDLPAQYDRSVF